MIQNDQISKKKKAYLILVHLIGALVLAVILCCVFGFLVMFLWNYLMPDLFGLKTLQPLQAIALVILTRLLFGSFTGKHFRSHNHKYKQDSDNSEEKKYCRIHCVSDLEQNDD